MPTRSLVVYRGPSRYDPETIIRAVLVLRSANVKTGDMAQLFILPDTVAPHTAQRTGDDAAVCGACPFRPLLSGGCYVTTFQGPLSTWRATSGQAVAEPETVALALAGRALRLGAYGDAAALPPALVKRLVANARGRVTGYTHGHKLLGMAGIAHLRTSCMLSVETEGQAVAAHAKGWRTFRGRAEGAPLLASEIECPSESRGIECVKCLLCRGASLPSARSISLPVHGFATRKALTVVAA